MKWFRMTSVAQVCAALIMLTLAQPFASYAQTPGQNLLTDGDFESPNWRAQDGIGELVIASGWRAWYVDVGQIRSYVKKPSTCDKSDPACYWMRPEFNSADFAEHPNRVHNGFKAQKYFSYGRMHEAGLYQQAIGIQPGATLRFSIYMQAWQCSQPEACQNGSRSDAPAEMHLRVGIDPYGGTDPLSANIVWSPETPAFDHWVQFSVQAQAKGGAVTVFTHSRAEWDYPRVNNDVYLDDASLAVTGEGTSVPGTVQPTGSPAPKLTPANTPTPRADGAVVHIVGPSDTLYGISLQYGVSYDDLIQLNNLSRTSVLTIGQVIVVKAGRGTAVSQQATPTTSTSTPANDTPTVASTVAPASTSTPFPPIAAPTDVAQPIQPAPGRANTTLLLIAVAILIVVIAVIALRRKR